MSTKLQPVRGTHDILPEEFEKFHAVITHARELATLYGFKEMATPIFEPTEVFARSLGDTSDIVHKEMFTFETKGGESVTLRPEFTAGIVRAFLSNGMQQHLPLKLFSAGPIFRYERPQKGRQRQFHQVNYEWFGDTSLEADVEIITLAGHLLLILSGQKCRLLINTLGDTESRAKYREALVSYLTPYTKELSEDSQRRLATNPLRILDTKSEQDKKILEAAPNMKSYLSDQARRRFGKICNLLGHESLPMFQAIDYAPSLVRGLDYYTDTVFEFIAETGELGAQNTVLAGGRYDGLVEQMGGKPTSAIGFAAGIERLLLLMGGKQHNDQRLNDIKIVILPFEEIETASTILLGTVLRMQLHLLLLESRIKQTCIVEIVWQGSIKKRIERAAKNQASHVIILGPEEVSRRECILKYMATSEQKTVSVDAFKDVPTLKALFNLPII